MSIRWLRGLRGPVYTDGTYNVNLAGAYTLQLFSFMHKILGYTIVDEVVADSRSFENAHEDSGVDGSFTGSSQVFTAASASFSSADRDKLVVIVDAAHPENDGIYPLVGTPSGTSGQIDFLCGTLANPIASTGMSWWLIDETNSPHTDGDIVVLQSPNAAQTQFKLRVSDNSYFDKEPVWDDQYWYIAGAGVTVATTGSSWNVSSHSWNANAPLIDLELVSPGYDAYGIPSVSTMMQQATFICGDTDGSFLCSFNCGNPTLYYKETSWIFSELEMFEPGHDASEKFYFGGTQGVQNTYYNWIMSRAVEDE